MCKRFLSFLWALLENLKQDQKKPFMFCLMYEPNNAQEGVVKASLHADLFTIRLEKLKLRSWRHKLQGKHSEQETAWLHMLECDLLGFHRSII